jgi:glycolate dehydrogenase FAD-linked subunit
VMKQMRKSRLRERLATIVGDDRVSDADFAQLAVSVESTAAGLSFLSPFSDEFTLPKIVVKPRTHEQVIEIVKLANETKTPLIIRGGGTGGSRGTLSQTKGILVDMTDMENLIHIDEASMAVTVQPGITWGKLRHELAIHGLRPGPLGPHGTWGATVGGALSYDSCCVDSHRYGQLSEDVLNLQVVLPTGEVIDTGSRSNPNSSVYHRYCNGPDLAGLFLGASGSLGIITEASIRVYPREEHTLHATFGFTRLEESCRTLHELSKLGYVDDLWMLCGRHTVEMAYPERLEDPEAVLAIYTAAHEEKSIKLRKQVWEETASNHGATELDPAFAQKFASDYEGFETATGQALSWGVLTIWPILKIPQMHAVAEKLLIKHEDLIMGELGKKQWSVYASGGAKHPMTDFYFGFNAERKNPKVRADAFEALKEMQKTAIANGAAMYDLGRLPGVDYLWSVAKPTYKFLKSLKKTLDPNNILNPGSLMLQEPNL